MGKAGQLLDRILEAGVFDVPRECYMPISGTWMHFDELKLDRPNTEGGGRWASSWDFSLEPWSRT